MMRMAVLCRVIGKLGSEERRRVKAEAGAEVALCHEEEEVLESASPAFYRSSGSLGPVNLA